MTDQQIFEPYPVEQISKNITTDEVVRLVAMLQQVDWNQKPFADFTEVDQIFSDLGHAIDLHCITDIMQHYKQQIK